MELLDRLSAIEGDSVIQVLTALAVSESDRDAANNLRTFLSDPETLAMTQGEAEMVLIQRLIDSITSIIMNMSNDEWWDGPQKTRKVASDPLVRVSLDTLFWFIYIVSEKKARREFLPIGIRSLWVVRPQPYVHGGPFWQVTGITVDEMIGHKRPLWAIKAGEDDVLGKDGEWELQPMPSSRTAEFFERTRWDDFDAALAFAMNWIAKQKDSDVEL